MSVHTPVSRDNDTDDQPYRAEVLIQGEWCCAAVRFATSSEALEHARDKFCAWTVPEEYRVVDSRSLAVLA